MKIIPGETYLYLWTQNLQLSKEDKKAGVKPYKVMKTLVTAVAEIPLCKGNQALWKTVDKDGQSMNAWANSLRRAK